MDKFKSKKFLISAVVLLVIITLSITAFFVFRGQDQDSASDPQRVANLAFQFDSVSLSPGESTTLDVLLETPISATEVDVVLVFDPEAILLNEIQPSANNFFGLPREYEIVENVIAQDLGQAVYSIRAAEVEAPTATKQGRGVVATLRITAHPTFQGSTPILIFKNEDAEITSMVKKANYNVSILEEAGSIEIAIE